MISREPRSGNRTPPRDIPPCLSPRGLHHLSDAADAKRGSSACSVAESIADWSGQTTLLRTITALQNLFDSYSLCGACRGFSKFQRNREKSRAKSARCHNGHRPMGAGYTVNLLSLAFLIEGDRPQYRSQDHARPVDPRQGSVHANGPAALRSRNTGSANCERRRREI